MGEWLKDFIMKSEKYNFPIHRPYYDLTQKEKDLLWHGARGLHGIDDFFKFVEENLYKIQYRVMQARYRGKTTCPVCKGSRLRPEALYVQVGGKNIAELVTMPVSEAKVFFDQLELDETDAAIAKRLLTEINNRLQFLLDVGLGYLALDRLSASLSGGESQRINLATSLGSSLVGSLYILDEPIAGVDPAARDYILRTIINNYNPEATVLISTHLIEDVEQVLDEVIFMRYGQLVLYTSVDNIREEKGKSVDAYFREVFAC